MLGSKLEALKCEALNKISREINKGHVLFAGDTRRFDGNFLNTGRSKPSGVTCSPGGEQSWPQNRREWHRVLEFGHS